MSKLIHKDLLNLKDIFGYLCTKGLCQGFSGMLMQAILAEEENFFWQRLTLIEKHKACLYEMVEKVTSRKSFNTQFQPIWDILAFSKACSFIQGHFFMKKYLIKKSI